MAILVGVAVVKFYSDHLAPAATVSGQAITKDEFKEAIAGYEAKVAELAARGST